MDRRLYQASLSGNSVSLHKLLEEDELLLDRVMATEISDTPLHIAALRGHVEFAVEILRQRPEIAHEMNSEGLSPLHLASASGHAGVVKELLKAVPDSVSDRDRQGRTPLHTAAIKGRVEVLKEIIRHKPESVGDVTSFGETVLHLCVKHDFLEVLKMMIGFIKDAEFVNRKDDNGNTVLHLSAAMKNFPITKFLLKETSVEVNSRNANGLTALDLLALYPKESTGDMEVAEFLRQKGAKRSRELFKHTGEVSEIEQAGHPQSQQNHPSPEAEKIDNMSPEDKQGKEESGKVVTLASLSQQIKEQWLQEMKQKHDDDNKNTMMVIAILIVTVTFQATLTPPGGLWQDDSNSNGTQNASNPTLASDENHRAGTAILNQINPTYLALFWFFNKGAFFASLMLIASLSEMDRQDTKETDSKVEITRRRRKALYLFALFSMELMYFFSSLPITGGTRLRVFVADIGAIAFVFLLFSPCSHKLLRKLRHKDKNEKRSTSGDGDIAIETQK